MEAVYCTETLEIFSTTSWYQNPEEKSWKLCEYIQEGYIYILLCYFVNGRRQILLTGKEIDFTVDQNASK